MPITALPDAPNRNQSPEEFADKGDALLGALPGFVNEANALQADVNEKAFSAEVYAVGASASAGLNNFKGVWALGNYLKGESVYHGTGFWIALQDSTDSTPAHDSVDWVALGVSGRKNLFINGDFSVWQRGVSSTSNGILADRWWVSGSIALPNLQVTQEPALMTSQKYGLRKQGDATAYTDEDVVQTDLQKVEDPITHSNKSVTLSAKIYSSVAREVHVGRYLSHVGGIESVGVHQKISIKAGHNHVVLTFQAEDFSGYTFDGSSFIGYELVWVVGSGIVNNIGRLAGGSTELNWSGGYIQYEEFQLELGPVASSFEAVPTSLSLLNCWRYYIRFTNTTGVINVGNGVYNTTTAILAWLQLPVKMRVAPSMAFSALSDFDIEPFDVAPDSITIGSGGTYGVQLTVTDPTARTQGFAGGLNIDTNGGWLEFDAEL